MSLLLNTIVSYTNDLNDTKGFFDGLVDRLHQNGFSLKDGEIVKEKSSLKMQP